MKLKKQYHWKNGCLASSCLKIFLLMRYFETHMHVRFFVCISVWIFIRILSLKINQRAEKFSAFVKPSKFFKNICLVRNIHYPARQQIDHQQNIRKLLFYSCLRQNLRYFWTKLSVAEIDQKRHKYNDGVQSLRELLHFINNAKILKT